MQKPTSFSIKTSCLSDANGLTFTVYTDATEYSSTFYSIGGGFVVKEDREHAKENKETKGTFPYPIDKAEELLTYCKKENKKISEIVFENEKSMRSEHEIHSELMRYLGHTCWNVCISAVIPKARFPAV